MKDKDYYLIYRKLYGIESETIETADNTVFVGNYASPNPLGDILLGGYCIKVGEEKDVQYL